MGKADTEKQEKSNCECSQSTARVERAIPGGHREREERNSAEEMGIPVVNDIQRYTFKSK